MRETVHLPTCPNTTKYWCCTLWMCQSHSTTCQEAGFYDMGESHLSLSSPYLPAQLRCRVWSMSDGPGRCCCLPGVRVFVVASVVEQLYGWLCGGGEESYYSWGHRAHWLPESCGHRLAELTGGLLQVPGAGATCEMGFPTQNALYLKTQALGTASPSPKPNMGTHRHP